MPNNPSTAKRLRQTKVRSERNKAIKSAMKTQMKKVLKSAADGDSATEESESKLAAKEIDLAGAKTVIQANKEARAESRLQCAIKTSKNAAA